MLSFSAVISIGSTPLLPWTAGADNEFELALEGARNEADFPALACCGALLLRRLGVLELKAIIVVNSGFSLPQSSTGLQLQNKICAAN